MNTQISGTVHSASQPNDSREITQQLVSMTDDINFLEHVVGALHERLVRVSRPVFAEKGCTGSEAVPEVAVSPVSDDIRFKRSRIAAISASLDELTKRLEV